MRLFPKLSTNRHRPLSPGNAVAAFAVCAVVGLVLAAVVAALAVDCGLGMDAVFALSSIIAFGIPGLVVRPLAVGRIKAGSFSVPLLLSIVVLAFVCQPVVQWASAVDYSCYSRIWGGNASSVRQNAELVLSVCHFDSIGGFLLTTLVVAALPALCEELLFRGALVPVVRRLTGGGVSAVIISAVVFSLVHADMTGFLARTVLGIFMGAVFVITRSIWSSVVFHFTNNFAVVYNLYLADDKLSLLTSPTEMPFVLVTLASLALSVGMVFSIYLSVSRQRSRHSAGRN